MGGWEGRAEGRGSGVGAVGVVAAGFVEGGGGGGGGGVLCGGCSGGRDEEVGDGAGFGSVVVEAVMDQRGKSRGGLEERGIECLSLWV